jgi:hypothetical protein
LPLLRRPLHPAQTFSVAIRLNSGRPNNAYRLTKRPCPPANTLQNLDRTSPAGAGNGPAQDERVHFRICTPFASLLNSKHLRKKVNSQRQFRFLGLALASLENQRDCAGRRACLLRQFGPRVLFGGTLRCKHPDCRSALRGYRVLRSHTMLISPSHKWNFRVFLSRRDSGAGDMK